MQSTIDNIALVLVIIGALNWGSIGLFGFDFEVNQVAHFADITLNQNERKLNENNLYINEFQLVYDLRKKEAKSVLLQASFNKIDKIQLENKIIGE